MARLLPMARCIWRILFHPLGETVSADVASPPRRQQGDGRLARQLYYKKTGEGRAGLQLCGAEGIRREPLGKPLALARRSISGHPRE